MSFVRHTIYHHFEIISTKASVIVNTVLHIISACLKEVKEAKITLLLGTMIICYTPSIHIYDDLLYSGYDDISVIATYHSAILSN